MHVYIHVKKNFYTYIHVHFFFRGADKHADETLARARRRDATIGRVKLGVLLEVASILEGNVAAKEDAVHATAVDGMATAVDGMATAVDGMATAVDGMATAVDGMAAAVDGTRNSASAHAQIENGTCVESNNGCNNSGCPDVSCSNQACMGCGDAETDDGYADRGGEEPCRDAWWIKVPCRALVSLKKCQGGPEK